MDSGELEKTGILEEKASQSKLSIGNSPSTAIGKEMIAWFWLQLRVKQKQNVFLEEEEQDGQTMFGGLTGDDMNVSRTNAMERRYEC